MEPNVRKNTSVAIARERPAKRTRSMNTTWPRAIAMVKRCPHQNTDAPIVSNTTGIASLSPPKRYAIR